MQRMTGIVTYGLGMRLHIGSGPLALPGWLNVDSQPYPGVDRVLDVRGGLPFEDVDAIFAEHFIEHLTLAEGMAFLKDCRRVLRPTGVLRISTPNLDWVWVISRYRSPDPLSDDQALLGCLELNRAFHGWGHRFLYNYTTLTRVLRSAGFAAMVRCAYRASEVRELRNLEQHPLDPVCGGIESLVVVEASGYTDGHDDLTPVIAPFLRDFNLA
jgi:predicted SAM-dependent methyltransferase